MARSVHWEKNAYRVFMGKPEGKRLLQRPNHSLVHNIKVEPSKKKDGDGLDSCGSELGPMENLCTE